MELFGGTILLGIITIVFAVWWIHRGVHGFEPGLFSRRRDVVDEVPRCDADGNLAEDIFCVTMGGYHKVPGLSTFQIMNLMISQRLYFRVSGHGDAIELLNDLTSQIGHYPTAEPHFEALKDRLLRGEQIDAWVYDIGMDRNSYYCQIKIVFYQHKAEQSTALTVSCILCGKAIADNELHICPKCAALADTFFEEMLLNIPKLQEEANRAGRERNTPLQRDRLQEMLSWLYQYKINYYDKGFHAIKDDINEQIQQIERAYREAQNDAGKD